MARSSRENGGGGNAERQQHRKRTYRCGTDGGRRRGVSRSARRLEGDPRRIVGPTHRLLLPTSGKLNQAKRCLTRWGYTRSLADRLGTALTPAKLLCTFLPSVHSFSPRWLDHRTVSTVTPPPTSLPDPDHRTTIASSTCASQRYRARARFPPFLHPSLGCASRTSSTPALASSVRRAPLYICSFVCPHLPY